MCLKNHSCWIEEVTDVLTFSLQKHHKRKAEEYIGLSKPELNESCYSTVVSSILGKLISNLSREDFFENKDKIIDLCINELVCEDKKTSISKQIKSKIDEFNHKKIATKKLNKELVDLKKESDNSLSIKNNINKIVVEI